MSDKAQRPPANEPWCWQTRELRASDAWRSQSINARRFVDFLLLEHMGKGGRANGELKAPQRQLEEFGMPKTCIADAIREAEELGLVDCRRAGMRAATTYALTWLPRKDGTPATDRWRDYRNTDLRPLPVKKEKSAPRSEGSAAPRSEGRLHKSAPRSEGRSAQNPAPRSEGAYNKLLTRPGDVSSDLSGGGR